MGLAVEQLTDFSQLLRSKGPEFFAFFEDNT